MLSSFSDKRIKTVRINPIIIFHQSKANMDRTVTDKVASKTISIHLSEHYEELFQHPAPSTEMASARGVYNLTQTLLKQKNQLSNQLEKIIYGNIPKLIPYMRHGLPKWLLVLLNIYPGKLSISRARTASIAKIKGLSADKAIAIKAKVKDGIGKGADKYTSRAIKSLSSKILMLDSQIKEEKQFLIDNYENDQLELFDPLKGIGIYTAIGALIEIEDVTRFVSASKMSSYFGVHPVFKQSGDGSAKVRMSKKGRASYRSLMYMAAHNVAMHNPFFKSIYAAQRAKGMGHNQALGVIMHKLTRIIYGMLTSNTPFDPNAHQNMVDKNEAKSREVKEEEDIQKQKDEINIAMKAPISSRAINKMKKELNVSILNAEERTRSIALSEDNDTKNKSHPKFGN